MGPGMWSWPVQHLRTSSFVVLSNVTPAGFSRPRFARTAGHQEHSRMGAAKCHHLMSSDDRPPLHRPHRLWRPDSNKRQSWRHRYTLWTAVDPEKAAAPELPVPQTTGLLSRLFELTLKALTSWVGLLGAYVGAVFVIFKNFKDVNEALKQVWPTAAPWLGIALVFSLPLLAFALHTIPSWIEQWRIRQYSQLGGASQPGYFTLRPRESEGGFERADNAHEEVSHWIENTQERVLYLTGASGTGKSSLLSAWVIPRLRRQNHVVIQLRGYEDLSVRIRDEIRRPGVIWNRPPATEDDLNYLLDRASQHLSGRHLFIVIDQFEEFLIFDDQDVASRDKQVAFKQLLSGQTIGQTFLLVYRPEYEGLIQ